MLQYVDMSGTDVICKTGHVDEEPYTTENLSRVPGGYKILTNISELLRVNFCNLCVSCGIVVFYAISIVYLTIHLFKFCISEIIVKSEIYSDMFEKDIP